MRRDTVRSIGKKKDTVCLYKLRNCYLGRESESKNCLILKGDFHCFYKFYRDLSDDNTVRILIISLRALERMLYSAVLRASISAYIVAVIALKSKSYSVSANFGTCIIDPVKSLLTNAFIAYWSRLKLLPRVT